MISEAKALLEGAEETAETQVAPIFISMHIGNTSPSILVAHVRSAFASSEASVRMTISYLEDEFKAKRSDDMVIIVAEAADLSRMSWEDMQSCNAPIAIIAENPVAAYEAATSCGIPLSYHDVISPAPREASWVGSAEEDRFRRLDLLMGRWIVSACESKALSCAAALPFVRDAYAQGIVKAACAHNAMLALASPLPFPDFPLMALNQARMARRIAAAYRVDADPAFAVELCAVAGGGLACRSIARGLASRIPLAAPILKPCVAAFGTAVIGRAAAKYFEAGRGIAGISGVAASIAAVSEKAASAYTKSTRSSYGEAGPGLGLTAR